ncbi:MAG: hypothetical protein IJK93_05365 [Muribaculaceae bacterium]|nr:hypothetical protein [Muribaculaceae bacterium]
MKKFFIIAALMLATTIALTACGDDEPKEKTKVTATYTMTFSQDLLDACNVFITYKAENGRNVMESVTAPQWTKTVTSDKFPAEFGVQYVFSTKSEAELTKEKYDLKCDFNFKYVTTKGASFANSSTIFDSQGLAKNKVVEYLKKYSGKSTGYKVTEDGNMTPANNLNYNN